LEDPGIYGIILEWILRSRVRLFFLRIGTGGGLKLIRSRNIGSNRIQRIYWLDEDL
jgi:hypothetical protein